MCGICGVLVREKCDFDTDLREMNGALWHRGPDEDGYFIGSNLGMAMRRLSIIDLETGKQPIYSSNKRFAIVFNGEIYNYRQLKSDYLSDMQFTTHSDTEVVVNMFQRFGTDSLKYLRGIFAFAIADIQLNTLFIARDHLGVKPLFYYKSKRGIWFSSDIGSFKKLKEQNLVINASVIPQYLQFGYIPTPHTIYKNVFKLPPGCYITIDQEAKYQIVNYYNLAGKFQYDFNDSYAVSAQKVRSLVTESVREQLVSDVPLGAFLSGGVDSSIIAVEMANSLGEGINTFTIGFKGSTNHADIELSRLLSTRLGTNHFEEIVDPHANATIDRMVAHMGEPFAITSAIPIYINSLVARKNVKVVLSGDGADELFGGYGRYVLIDRYRKLNWLRKLPIKHADRLLSELVKLSGSPKVSKGYRLKIQSLFNFLQSRNKFEGYLSIMGVNNLNIVSQVFPSFNYHDYLRNETRRFDEHIAKIGFSHSALMLYDCQTSLVDEMLNKVDFSSMLASLEVRVPFLDYRIAEYALSLPDQYKISSGIHKKILKEVYREALPQQILNAPKRGFNLPLESWIRRDWVKEYAETFNSNQLLELGINGTQVSKMFNRFLKGAPYNGKLFFYLFILNKWYAHNR